jgi:hypothetical protein
MSEREEDIVTSTSEDWKTSHKLHSFQRVNTLRSWGNSGVV